MKFQLQQAIQVLEKTPAILHSYLHGLSSEWLKNNEGPDTWSPYDVVGHLIEGEQTDWMVRVRQILSNTGSKVFEPFDRFAQMQAAPNRSIEALLQEFQTLRENNLNDLRAMNLEANDFQKTGIHPDFGTVTLEQLLATWVVHDLGHIGQISRVMAKQYQASVGPWEAYLGILRR